MTPEATFQQPGMERTDQLEGESNAANAVPAEKEGVWRPNSYGSPGTTYLESLHR
jgi:hypothetical protein